jgi:nucleotide-binding universal stress UspA family protein
MTTPDAHERKQAADRQSATNVYARIVVALDGLARAELVLPYVEALAEQFGSSVTLLRATTPAAAIAGAAVAATMPPVAPNVAATPIDPSAVVAAERREVERYLHALAQRLRNRGLTVSAEQHEGSAADCDRQAGARIGRKRDRHDHPWPRRDRAPSLRLHRRRGAAARALPGVARAGARGA